MVRRVRLQGRGPFYIHGQYGSSRLLTACCAISYGDFLADDRTEAPPKPLQEVFGQSWAIDGRPSLVYGQASHGGPARQTFIGHQNNLADTARTEMRAIDGTSEVGTTTEGDGEVSHSRKQDTTIMAEATTTEMVDEGIRALRPASSRILTRSQTSRASDGLRTLVPRHHRIGDTRTITPPGHRRHATTVPGERISPGTTHPHQAVCMATGRHTVGLGPHRTTNQDQDRETLLPDFPSRSSASHYGENLIDMSRRTLRTPRFNSTETGPHRITIARILETGPPAARTLQPGDRRRIRINPSQ